jgi:hypothetical protein
MFRTFTTHSGVVTGAVPSVAVLRLVVWPGPRTFPFGLLAGTQWQHCGCSPLPVLFSPAAFSPSDTLKLIIRRITVHGPPLFDSAEDAKEEDKLEAKEQRAAHTPVSTMDNGLVVRARLLCMVWLATGCCWVALPVGPSWMQRGCLQCTCSCTLSRCGA